MPGEILDSSLIKLRRMRSEEVVDPEFDLINVCEVFPQELSIECAEEVIIGKGHVWRIQWLQQNLSVEVADLADDGFCNMWMGIVHQDEHLRASQTTALQYLDHVIDMSREDFGHHHGAWREHVVESYAIDSPSHGEKHLLGTIDRLSRPALASHLH